ncbi:MAG: nucleoside monophosphate kinase [Parcubacteria group bacterium]|nr:nucleoside monophosphate kinase [Parcubacteria group bacterium]
MKGVDFPIFKTKTELRAGKQKFQLEDPVERRKYFELKAGQEIEKLRNYLRDNTFVGFLLGKKNSGKGTYAKLFMEAVGGERVGHISVGDIVRAAHKKLSDEKYRKEFEEFLRRRYRGFVRLEKIFDIILGRDTKTLLPTEIILALLEQEIDRMSKKAIFIDGFPRDLDQISYSLYFRTLIGYREDPDFFVFIDVPEAVIDERMKYRVVCPQCQTPRNIKLLRTKEIDRDHDTNRFYLLCDNPNCGGYGKDRMISKEGDELGIEAIRDRIEIDDKVMSALLELQGVPKIFLRNSVPVARAEEFIDDYEITPAYRYDFDQNKKMVRVIEEPYIVNDDQGEPSYSLLPAPVALSLIKQIVAVLNL